MLKQVGRPSTKSNLFILIPVAIIAIINTGCISVGHKGSSTPVTSEDCLDAAREAGLPADVLDKIENPQEMNRFQKFAIRKTLEGAGLGEVCESALDD